MSTLPDNDLDLEKLFLPAWAQEPSSTKQFAQYEGGEERKERRDRRPFRRERGPGNRPRENRPRADRPSPRRHEGGKKPFNRGKTGPRRDEPRERRPPPPLPEVNVSFVPEEKGVESLARQIKTAGRAYPLFDIARLILQKPDRYSVEFGVRKKPDGQIAQPLFVCALDDTLWLSEDEAVAHVLKNHFSTFYQTDRTATEPPKGKYTFVAQCGMSGVILGPPNHHDYQNQLRKLHAQRFSRMPFEVFKSRVKIVRDEEVVKKWIDDQSWKTEYICLNMPEPLRLGSREAVERHFRELHKENIIKSTESHTLSGTASRGVRSPELARLIRQAWEDQRRFPLQLATSLSQQFATHGLQFFKVNKTFTHVSVARPHYLDLDTTPVSEGVKRIVEYINANPKCTRRKLIESLAPAPAPAPRPVPAPSPEAAAAEAAAASPATASPATPAPAEASEPSPEQTAVIADLHWLIHQGHVIEFANGVIETAKKPLPKPPKPEVKPSEAPSESPSATAPPAESTAPAPPAQPAAAGQPADNDPPEPSAAPAASEPNPEDTAKPDSVATSSPVPEPNSSDVVPPPTEESIQPTPPPAAEAPDENVQHPPESTP